jgi:uncharacterized protein YjbJ (UPF0337 family)
MNQDFLKGKWTEVKGEIQKTWGKLTGDELEKTKGDLKAIAGLVQQRYGVAQEESMNRVSSIIKKFDDKLVEKKTKL